MTLERKWGAIFCAVGAFLIIMMVGPLADTRMVTALYALGLLGGALAVILGAILVIGGKPDATET